MAETKDWTQSRSGVSNASRSYLRIVKVVEGILRNHRIGDDPHLTARNIVSELAHGHGFEPGESSHV